MKILNANLILIYNFYNKNPKESDLFVKEIIDPGGNFARDFNSQTTRKEIVLNISNSMLIKVNQKTYLYDYNSNKMQMFNKTNFNHEVEKLRLYQNTLNFKNKWENVGSITEPRSYFSIFVQDNKKIYLMFGYNFKVEKYLDYFHYLDVSQGDQYWDKIYVKGEKIPKLSCCATMSFSSDHVYIFGGIDHPNEKNNCIYRYNAETNLLDQTELTLKSSFDYMDLNPKLKCETLPSLNFIEETNFQALNFHVMHTEHAFYFGCFDSKNFLHLINLKTFSHDLFYLDISMEEETINEEIFENSSKTVTENSKESKKDSYDEKSRKYTNQTNKISEQSGENSNEENENI